MVTSSFGETVARRFFYALLQIGSSLLVDRGGGLLVTNWGQFVARLEAVS